MRTSVRLDGSPHGARLPRTSGCERRRESAHLRETVAFVDIRSEQLLEPAGDVDRDGCSTDVRQPERRERACLR